MKIIAILSIAVCFAFIFSVPFRKTQLRKKADSPIFLLSNNSLPFAIVIFVASLFIIASSIFIRLNFFFKIILCASSMLATFIASRESVSAKSEGVFENGIIANGRLFLFSEIQSFHLLQNEKEMQSDTIVVLELKNGKSKEVLCKTAREAKRVLDSGVSC